MTYDIEQKREEIKKAYPRSDHWLDKVNKMSTPQVVAVWMRFKREKKI